MKRHLIFPALALVAALSTAALAGWGSDPSTEVSDAVATQASGGAVCSFWAQGYCGGGTNPPPGCVLTYCWVGNPMGTKGTATSETYCGVSTCLSVYAIQPGCGVTSTTTTVTNPTGG
jgi:hypothetical protein